MALCEAILGCHVKYLPPPSSLPIHARYRACDTLGTFQTLCDYPHRKESHLTQVKGKVMPL